ncbi:MnmA/TRMU family protein [Campylobacter sp. VicNov18]|uniref:MnmA/TRMU family protein n=1 Tax=Campylobacter bilis TaxID=2691918 RepID=UPI00130DA1F6|nr:MnmA/TRMU family protein [Campylobacter bilis]MPV63759.1 ATP-binding protein [Campylobacter hepaticus]MBM0637260.1 ATP-binding protein [Campylobacter bilis]MCC8277979.1 MnmA/TRMU family protein [Campylobacter bilis]MCC8299483.1 MnmA/TRMU family protein [Campylobacter bilis]MCC8300888.1 MnmA/TRMU family protein [Campylobacter bilis]
MKALALFSGGLDSMLAMKLITLQGIEVKALNINIGFGSTSDKSEIMKKRAAMVGADFEMIDVRNAYLQQVLFNPQYGYGKHFNPCIDCHAFMFKTALSMLKEEKANFIITGEVLGQRPMSQRGDAMAKVKKLALDEEDLILRPMCAKNLPLTKPEREGWVDREKLENISGRSRKRQLELAQLFGLEDFESPGGGCLLTLNSFAKKIRDFIEFDKDMQVNDAQLLKYGRHLRLPEGSKMIIGRNELENTLLKALKTPKYEAIDLKDLIGAYSLVDEKISNKDLELALKIALSYSKHEVGKSYELGFKNQSYKSIAFEDKKNIAEFFIS